MLDRSDEAYVGTERGRHKVLTLRRREATERVDFTFLNAVSARSWDVTKGVREAVRVVLPDAVSSPVDGRGGCDSKGSTSVHQQG